MRLGRTAAIAVLHGYSQVVMTIRIICNHYPAIFRCTPVSRHWHRQTAVLLTDSSTRANALNHCSHVHIAIYTTNALTASADSWTKPLPTQDRPSQARR